MHESHKLQIVQKSLMHCTSKKDTILLRCDRIFDDHVIANSLLCVAMKRFQNIGQLAKTYGQCLPFLTHDVKLLVTANVLRPVFSCWLNLSSLV